MTPQTGSRDPEGSERPQKTTFEQFHANTRARSDPRRMSRVATTQDRMAAPGPLGRILRMQLPHGERRAHT